MTNELEELKELARRLGFEVEDFGDDEDTVLIAGNELCAEIGGLNIVECDKFAELRRFLLLPEMDVLRQRLRRRKQAWLALRACVKRNMISHGSEHADAATNDDWLDFSTGYLILSFADDEIEKDGDRAIDNLYKRPKQTDEDVARWAYEYNSLTELIDDQVHRMLSKM